MELKQRVRHITRVLHNFLPERFSDAAKILTEISIELKKEERPQGFAHIFLPDYVECFGLDYPEEALSALGEITRLVSAEFAVRPFIVRYPQLSIRFLQSWSKSQDANVRRLASEGSRPRLPWAQTLAALRSDPTPVLPILENLKADPSLYVRKSVANHLNDIAKDHPALVLNIAKKWQGRHPATDWIIKHGCRTLLKGGNREVM